MLPYGPVFSDHETPKVLNVLDGIIRAHKHPMGYTSNMMTTVGIVIAGLRILRNMLIAAATVTNKNPTKEHMALARATNPHLGLHETYQESMLGVYWRLPRHQCFAQQL